MKTLSCCLIAKNEEQNIERCLKSIVNAADEIILVDTGSSDHTPEISEKYGAKVIKSSFQNDFSYARNISLENATCDWILFLDCDEELDFASANKIRNLIQSDDYEAYYINFDNKLNGNCSAYAQSLRLFKNNKAYRFKGKIHEQIVYSIVDANGYDKIGHSDILVYHYGYNSNNFNISAKVKRNIDILNSYKKEDKNGFYYYNLGTEYLRSNDYSNAINCYLKSLDFTTVNQSFAPILSIKLINSFMAIKKYKDALFYCERFKKIFPDFSDLYYYNALIYISIGKLSMAVKYLEKYLSMPRLYDKYSYEESLTKNDLNKLISKLKSGCIKKNEALSVCIIARNEDYNIEECIKSINEIADEVIVIDSESTDNTKLLSENLMAKVYSYKWNNSYKDIRNYALSKSSSKWILYLNGDEILNPSDLKKLSDCIRSCSFDGYMLKIHTIFDYSSTFENTLNEYKCRLFKNSYKYNDILLEDIDLSINKSNKALSYTNIELIHNHYLNSCENINLKQKVMLSVIDEAEKVANCLSYIYQKGILFALSQNYDKAIECFKLCLKNNYIKAEIYYFYSLSLLSLKEYNILSELLKDGIKRFPQYTELVYIEALSFFMKNDIDTSIELFEKCISMGESDLKLYVTSSNCADYKAKKSLSYVYFLKGNFEKAKSILLDISKNSLYFDEAVKELTLLFIKSNKISGLKGFLRKNNIYNKNSVYIISITCAKLKCFNESLDFILDAVDTDKNNENTINIKNSFNILLDEIKKDFEITV